MPDLTDQDVDGLEPGDLAKLVAYAQACGVNASRFVEDARRRKHTPALLAWKEWAALQKAAAVVGQLVAPQSYPGTLTLLESIGASVRRLCILLGNDRVG